MAISRGGRMKPIKAKWIKQFVVDIPDEEIPCTIYGFATSCDRPVAIVKFDGAETLDYVSVGQIKIESEE